MEFEDLTNIDPRNFWKHEAHDFTPEQFDDAACILEDFGDSMHERMNPALV